MDFLMLVALWCSTHVSAGYRSVEEVDKCRDKALQCQHASNLVDCFKKIKLSERSK
jgi:hypothetical protein